jgi:hypothetical protein
MSALRAGPAMGTYMNRTTSRTVRFARPFVLPGVEGENPPGTYAVEIDEAPQPGAVRPVHRRIEARITVPFNAMGAVGHQTVPVTLEALEAALARDTAAEPAAAEPAAAETAEAAAERAG